MSDRGFTLIELVVTMGIMVLITSVTLANNAKFGGKILLRSTAYNIALALREAQTYGISVRKISVDDAGEFQSPYGVHFSAGEPTRYWIFADTYKDNGILTRGEDGIRNTSLEDVTEYVIGKGYKLNKLCVGSTEDCVNVAPGNSGSLDITFKRPEPDASIRFGGISNNIYNKARIELISPRGDTVNILVEVSGQISVTK